MTSHRWQEVLAYTSVSSLGRSPNTDFVKKKKVRVKLAGDGTNIGKWLHVVNFGFTILDKGEAAYSAAGNHCLAIFKEPETYESLKAALRNIASDVESLLTIDVNGMTFELEYYLGRDWKFLALVTGIDSVSSKYACIWCKCHISQQKWSILDPKFGAHSIEENIVIASSCSKKFNASLLPIFPTILLSLVMVDNLHTFLSRHTHRSTNRLPSYNGQSEKYVACP